MKRATFDEIRDIKWQLREIAEKEAMNLYRLARKAQEHGVSDSVVAEIREEARNLERNGVAYPERILDWKFEYETKYAFR